MLNDEFGFTLDAASSDLNAKCEKHYTREQDGLGKDWGTEHVWVNPPFGAWPTRVDPQGVGSISQRGARGDAPAVPDRR